MIRLSLDAQLSQITLTDTEVEKDGHTAPPMSSFTLWYGYGPENPDDLRFCECILNDVDFEGFVLEIVGKDGEKFSTEIVGLVMTK